MSLRRLLSGVTAIACFAALLASSDEKPADGIASPPTHAELPTSMDASVKAEQHWSLAQTSWTRTKLCLPSSRQSSFGFPVRILLAVLLFVFAIVAYSPNLHPISDQPRRLTEAFLKSLSFEASNAESTKAGMPLKPLEQPRQLTKRLLHSISSEASKSKSNHEAAGRTVANLRQRYLRHKEARLESGDDGLLDDDRDSAQILGDMSEAKDYAQRQQFETAAKLYMGAVHMAHGMLNDFMEDKTGPVEVDEAQHLVIDAVMQTATFYLERGQVGQAKNVLEGASKVIKRHLDPVDLRCRLLYSNVRRDSGDFGVAVADYEALLKKIPKAMVGVSPDEKARLNEIAIETQGEHARALLSHGAYAGAHKLLDKALEQLKHLMQDSPPLLLAARLKGLLAFVLLKEGDGKTAVDLLDESLANIGELPSGLAGATSEIQELLQSRAMAKAAIGSLDGAAEDLDVVRELQDELKKSISDEHDMEYYEGNGKVPDPRLWASIARTRTIAAEFKLLTKSGNDIAEAMALAKQARELLREVKRTNEIVPKDYSLASSAEVKDLIARLQTKATQADSSESISPPQTHHVLTKA